MELPPEIEEHYLKGQESQRLSSSQGELEKLRTQAILSRNLPAAPAVVFDIGAGQASTLSGLHSADIKCTSSILWNFI
jgi:hypothetical protein